ncbi:hypothetical protein Celal_3559 [Cellulophaga algicola DSM 14237]|uniref:Uncharacterized protein n=1 Tax=Cellulophaga algicola (strain DSM 14237 / IC166 / ACAM 630) TaxID=688270 RepID=E6X8G5_CELAD|nr:hypothetical protein [Cellulophaga algicola]ADV50821.1 hypothetical protein Celal_3559 [Cellulophaga algicola DSM 14237]
MKNKLLLIIIFMLFTFPVFSQSKSLVTSYLATLFQIVEHKKTEEFYATLYPKFKEQIPEDQISSFLGELHSNPNFKTEIKNSKIIEIGKIIKDKNKAYALVDYVSETHIEFTDKATEALMDKGRKHFKKLYGARYWYDDDKKLIVTSKDFKIVMVYENERWSHIPGAIKLKPYLNYWIEEKIIDSLFND